MRGFFEPAHPGNGPAGNGAAEIDGRPNYGGDARRGGQAAGAAAPPGESRPGASRPEESRPSAAAAKLDQIKDLYLTAEAIGEDALTRHFQQVSERQRQLIREYFNEVASGSSDS